MLLGQARYGTSHPSGEGGGLVDCFDILAKDTAAFYSVKEKKGSQPKFDTGQHGGNMVDWKYMIEHVVYPAVLKTLVPPSACLTDRTLLQLASLPDLYKVFERC